MNQPNILPPILLGDSAANKLNEESFFQPETGKLTFKSYLDKNERTAVRKVASGVSEELGLKLLAPTPGSKLLIKHLTRDPEADKKKDITKGMYFKVESGGSKRHSLRSPLPNKHTKSSLFLEYEHCRML